MKTKKGTKQSKKEEISKTAPEVPEGYEEVGDYWDEMFAFENKGDEFKGMFVATIPNIGENQSNVHVFKVEGQRVGIWGSTILDNRMADIERNDSCMIVFEGQEVSPKSGRLFKSFKVYRKPGLDMPKTPGEDDIPF